MSLPLDKMLLHLALLPHILLILDTQPVLRPCLALPLLQPTPQHNAMWKCYHLILRPVHNHDALLTNRLGNLL